MRIEFDSAKDAVNRVKHGVSLVVAADMDFDSAVIEPDRRHDYGEDRFQGLGMIGGRLHVLAFTFRDGTVRAISLRKANARDRRYAKSS